MDILCVHTGDVPAYSFLTSRACSKESYFSLTCACKETTLMKENWHKLDNVTMDDSGCIQATARVDKNSPWFSGHFPGEPVLPGIAQISMACEAVRRHKNVDGPFHIKEIRKLRFRRVIRPEEPITLQIMPNDRSSGLYRFKISVKNELACNGIIVFE